MSQEGKGFEIRQLLISLSKIFLQEKFSRKDFKLKQ